MIELKCGCFFKYHTVVYDQPVSAMGGSRGMSSRTAAVLIVSTTVGG